MPREGHTGYDNSTTTGPCASRTARSNAPTEEPGPTYRPQTTHVGRLLHRDRQIRGHRHLAGGLRCAGAPAVAFGFRYRRGGYRYHHLFQHLQRPGHRPGDHSIQETDRRGAQRHLFVHDLVGIGRIAALFRQFVADRLLLRLAPAGTHLPVSVGQPAFRSDEHRPQRIALQTETVQIHRNAQPLCPRIGRNHRSDCGPFGRRYLRTADQPDRIEYRAIHRQPAGTSATGTLDGRPATVAHDLRLLGLPVLVQRDQLLHAEPGQTTDRQIHEHESAGLLRKIVPADDAAAAKHHQHYFAGDAPHFLRLPARPAQAFGILPQSGARAGLDRLSAGGPSSTSRPRS